MSETPAIQFFKSGASTRVTPGRRATENVDFNFLPRYRHSGESISFTRAQKGKRLRDDVGEDRWGIPEEDDSPASLPNFEQLSISFVIIMAFQAANSLFRAPLSAYAN